MISGYFGRVRYTRATMAPMMTMVTMVVDVMAHTLPDVVTPYVTRTYRGT
jgi:hypothetical protein